MKEHDNKKRGKKKGGVMVGLKGTKKKRGTKGGPRGNHGLGKERSGVNYKADAMETKVCLTKKYFRLTEN